jgi:segregation and condensation protein B
MERSEQRRIAEAVILGSPEPIAAGRVADLIPGGTTKLVRELVEELNAEYAEHRRAFEISHVGGGYQIRTLPEFAAYLQQVQPTRPLRLSRAALETLAIVAYRQPVTRGEVEHIRGVDAGAVMRSLLERKLVRIAGHREVAGRPLLYGTSRRFLEVFGLATLGDLPTLRDLKELASEDAPLSGAGPSDSSASGDPGASELNDPVHADSDEEADETPPTGGDPASDFFSATEPPGKPH